MSASSATACLSFRLDLAWSQVSLFDANLADPFNDWEERHLAQGFTWRPGSVSFRTPLNQGEIDVTVELVDAVRVDPEAERAIVVPFTTWAGLVEVSTIAGSRVLDVPPGRYAVLFQTGVLDGQSWCSFGLLASPYRPVHAAILRGDHPDLDLLMEAEPAA